MAATRNKYASHGDTFSQTPLLGGRASFLVLSQGDSSVQLPLPLRGTSVQGRLPQALGFPMGEPPLQVSLHGELQASIPSLEGVFIPGSPEMGLGGLATHHLRGKPLSRSPLKAYTSGQYPPPPFTRSLLPKTPPGTASINLGASLMPGIPCPEGNLCIRASPTEAPFLRANVSPTLPRPLRLSSLSSGGRVYPGRPTENPKTPSLLPHAGAGLPLDPLPSGGTSALAPSPPPAAPRCPLRPRRAG